MIYYPKKLELSNAIVLDVLDEVKDLVFSNSELLEEAVSNKNNNPAESRFSNEYLFSLLDKPLNEITNNYGYAESNNWVSLRGKCSKTLKKIKHLNNIFGGHHYFPLAALYPPGGYITWHHNGNSTCVPCYNLLFSYSTTGEGSFRYYDYEKNDVVEMIDSSNEWAAKIMYFSSNNCTNKLLWHSAHTSCYRISIAFALQEKDVEPAISLLNKRTL